MLNFDENGKLTEPIKIETTVKNLFKLMDNPLPEPKEMVDHPKHYCNGPNDPYEVINIIEHFNLNFSMGNVLKYMLRAGKKDEELQDLKKAIWYLKREIERKEKSNV